MDLYIKLNWKISYLNGDEPNKEEVMALFSPVSAVLECLVKCPWKKILVILGEKIGHMNIFVKESFKVSNFIDNLYNVALAWNKFPSTFITITSKNWPEPLCRNPELWDKMKKHNLLTDLIPNKLFIVCLHLKNISSKRQNFLCLTHCIAQISIWSIVGRQ